MNGNEVYDEQFKKKIEYLLGMNQNKKYLRGFYNYMNGRYTTKYSYLYHVVSFMNYNKKNIEDISFDDYNEYLALSKDKTASYQITVYSALKKFSLYLYASKRNKDNPMLYILRPDFEEGIKTKEKREKGYLTEKEKDMVLESILTGVGGSRAVSCQKEWKERDLLIIKLAIFTALRCSALFKLNVENVDFKNNKLTAVDKGGKIQVFPLDEQMVKCICDWLNKRKELLNGKEENALFISNQKTRMTQSSIYRIVRKYSECIEGKKISPHKLRATCGTHLLREGKDIYMVQRYLGHSSPKTTELYIRGQLDEVMERGADIMSNMIK